MPIESMADALQPPMPPHGSLLALDVSKRRIGLAGTDPERRLVTPLLTFARGKWAEDVARLAATIREREVVGLVVGLPLNMDGSEGPMAQAARAAARNLAAAFGLPVHLQDERLTTFAVRDAITAGRLPRPKRRDEPLDHYAAAVILEDYLREMAREPHPLPDDCCHDASDGEDDARGEGEAATARQHRHR